MKLLSETLQKIEAPDRSIGCRVKQDLARLLPPPRSFGRLGDMIGQYASVIRELQPRDPSPCMVVTCADHGVARNGISAYPVDTTRQMTLNYVVSKGASANAFANYSGSDMAVVDVGVVGDLSGAPGLWHRKIAEGTKDFTQGAAMTREQAVQAIEAGIEIVNEKVRRESVKIIVQAIKKRGFLVDGKSIKIDRENNQVNIVAQKPSGAKAEFKVFLDGKFEYRFDGYEGQACQKDIKPFMDELEEVYGIKVLKQTEIWSNPDKNSTMKYQTIDYNKNKG